MSPRKDDQVALRASERIVVVRGERVLLDSDLAALYGVETKALNQAVKRNAARFPGDFAFRLSRDEAEGLQRSRSQSVTLKRGLNVKYLPWAFTEHGAIMAASVLNSARAVEMSIFVVRAFVRLRDLAGTHAEIARQLDLLERRVTAHDRSLEQLFAALRAPRASRPSGARDRLPAREGARRELNAATCGCSRAWTSLAASSCPYISISV